jgi:hypothetical protein
MRLLDVRVASCGRWRPIILAGLLLAVAGCVLPFAYRHADWLVLWKLDQYFDLSRAQKNSLAEQLKAHLARHQKDALPGYIAFLSQIRDRCRGKITREDVEWVFATYERLRADLFEGFVQDGAVFLASVDEEQVRHLEQRFQKDNEATEHLLREPAAERLAERAESTMDLLHDWLGPLSAEQTQRITRLSLALPDTQQIRLNYQRQRQRTLLHLLRSTRDRDALGRGLRDVMVHPEHHAAAEFRRATGDMQRAVIDMILAVERIITQRQRDHLLKKLQELIDELTELTVS